MSFDVIIRFYVELVCTNKNKQYTGYLEVKMPETLYIKTDDASRHHLEITFD
jgi:hypothetical protein